jgi:hypothetical protein
MPVVPLRVRRIIARARFALGDCLRGVGLHIVWQEAGKMAQDYFAPLGLSPGTYDPVEIARRFRLRRAQLLAALDDPQRYADVRRELDQLYLAYAALRDSRLPAQPAAFSDAEPAGKLRELIAASIEDGLLRHSRRQAILQAAREMGVSEFQAQLMIAEVQFGEPVTGPVRGAPARAHASGGQVWARVAGIGALAAAIFLMLVHWMHG